MYTHNKKIQLALLLSLLLFSGCKKYLSAIPDTSIAVPESLSQIQFLLDNAAKMNLNRTPNFGESSTDDYYLQEAAYNAFDQVNKEIYTWSVQEYTFQNDWSNAYEPVYISNYSLEALAKIPVTDATLTAYNNAKGSALFFRSYHFLNLLWVFAKAYDPATASSDLGIALRTSSDFNVPSVRSNVADCYNKIINDVKEAIPLLPEYPLLVMRPSKTSAYALLARTYLSMRMYDSAMFYADKSLLLNNYIMDYNNDPDIPNGLNALVPFKQFNKETLFYSEMGTTYGVITVTRTQVDTLLYASYNVNDLRRTGFYSGSGALYQFKGSYTGSANKYFTGITTAEMLLTKIECKARSGQWVEAMDMLNQFQQKRWKQSVTYTPLTAYGNTEALQIILNERRKELYMRGLRFMDIKRLNKEGANITLTRKVENKTFTLLPNANYYAIPLPIDIIRITGMAQNPR